VADQFPDVDSGTPRWVKVAGIVALAVVVLIVVAILLGQHDGPSRHSSSDSGMEDSAQEW
jgi:hypothetical protein